MKIATTIGGMYNYAPIPADAVRCYKGTGFRYLDYSFYTCYTGNSPFLLDSDKEWKQQVEDAGNAAADCGFKFVQAHAPGYNPMGEVPDHAACMRAMRRSVEACGMLGISATVVHTSFSMKHPYPDGKDEYFAYNREFLRGMLEEAEKYGVYVCAENSSAGNMGTRYFPRTPEELNEFVDFVNHPLLKVCWDTGHSVMEGNFDQYDILQKLGSNLKAIHVHDNNGLSDQHIAPYCGRLDLDQFVKGLIDSGYSGYFTYEADCFLNSHKRAGASQQRSPLQQLPLELRQESLALLYKIAKFMLETYGVFEE